MTSSDKTMDWNGLTQFHCQKHGDIGHVTINVSITPLGKPTQVSTYCLYCFNDMLAAHCHTAVPIIPTDS